MDQFVRRVYQREFERLTGFGTTWFGMQVKRGVIPPPSRDPGGKRNWWTSTVVAETLAKLNASAAQAPRDKAAV